MNLDVLGCIAAALTTGAFVPQAFKTFRTRDTSGISLATYMVFTIGVALWLVYGVAIGSWPITFLCLRSNCDCAKGVRQLTNTSTFAVVAKWITLNELWLRIADNTAGAVKLRCECLH